MNFSPYTHYTVLIFLNIYSKSEHLNLVLCLNSGFVYSTLDWSQRLLCIVWKPEKLPDYWPGKFWFPGGIWKVPKRGPICNWCKSREREKNMAAKSLQKILARFGQIWACSFWSIFQLFNKFISVLFVFIFNLF